MVLTVIVLVYVDDLMVLGDMLHIQEIFHKLFLVFVIIETGRLYQGRANVRFIGRLLQRTGDGLLFVPGQACFIQICNEFEVIDCKETSTPATSTTAIITASEEPLDSDQRSQYRRVVG